MNEGAAISGRLDSSRVAIEQTLATAALTFEESLELGSQGTTTLNLSAGPRTLLVQGHCHQRSLVGMEAFSSGRLYGIGTCAPPSRKIGASR